MLGGHTRCGKENMKFEEWWNSHGQFRSDTSKELCSEIWAIASRESKSAVPSDFVHRIFIIMDGDKELERLADADTAIDLLLIHQNGEHPRARIFKMKI